MIKINNTPISDINNKLFLSDVPNILNFELFEEGTNAYARIGWDEQPDFTRNIIINGVNFIPTNDKDIAKTQNHFYSEDSGLFAVTLCDSINKSQLSANYNAYLDGFDVVIMAKEKGWQYDLVLNIPQGLTYTNVRGTGNENDGTEFRLELFNNNTFLCSMNKTMYNCVVKWDLRELLNKVVDYGNTFKLLIKIYSVDTDGLVEYASTDLTLNVMNGYKLNESLNYLDSNNFNFLQYVGNGTEYYNQNELYIYDMILKFTMYYPDADNHEYYINYMDSSKGIIYSQRYGNNGSNVYNNSVKLLKRYFDMSNYIGVQNEDGTTLLYKVIKGVKATDKSTKIEWYNEYGGISFFDFCGQHSSSTNISNATYSTSDYDYYTASKESKELISDKSVRTSYTVQSHIITESGAKIFESLAKASKVWVGTKEIIIDNVSVQENSDYNDCYVATVQYHYSRE